MFLCSCIPSLVGLGSVVALSMGRVQLWKCLTFLSFSCLWKAGRCRERESSREREWTCSDPGQIIRDYTNHAHIHLQSLLHIHSALLTAVWCSIRHIYYSPHSVIQKGGAFWLETSDTFVWLCVIVCFQVPSRRQAEGRAFVLRGRQSYPGNRHAKTGPALPGSAAGRHYRDLQSQCA